MHSPTKDLVANEATLTGLPGMWDPGQEASVGSCQQPFYPGAPSSSSSPTLSKPYLCRKEFISCPHHGPVVSEIRATLNHRPRLSNRNRFPEFSQRVFSCELSSRKRQGISQSINDEWYKVLHVSLGSVNCNLLWIVSNSLGI